MPDRHPPELTPILRRLRADLERAVNSQRRPARPKPKQATAVAGPQVKAPNPGKRASPVKKRRAAEPRSVKPVEPLVPSSGYHCPICLKTYSKPLASYRGKSLCDSCMRLLRRD